MTTRTGPAGPATTISEPDHTGAGAAATATRVVWWSTAIYLLARAAVVLVADTPSITPDELGSWAIAGYLVGDDPLISMRDMPRYSLMSGVAIAPVQALGLEPEVAYRLAVVWLSAFGVGAALLARRTVDLLRPGRPVLSAAVYGLVLLFPATLGTSFFTWAEPVVLLWWGVIAWSTAKGIVLGDGRALLVGSLAAGFAPVVHGRLIVAPVIWLAAMACLAVDDRRGRGDVIAGAADPPRRPWPAVAVMTVALTAAAGLVVDRAAASALWEGSSLVVDPAADPTSASWWTGLVVSSAARLWYAVAATAGLAVLGASALLRGVRSGAGRARIAAASSLGLLGANLAIGVLFLSSAAGDLDRVGALGGLRWDHVVYGRYVDGAVLALAALGLVVAAGTRGRDSSRTLWWSTVVLVACTLVVGWRVAGHDLAPAIDLMVGGVAWIPSLWAQPATILWWGAAGVALTAATALATRRGSAAVLVVVATWTVAGALLTTVAVADRHRDVAQPDLAAQVGAPAERGDVIRVAADAEALPRWRLGIYAQQRDLAHLGWQFRFTDSDSKDLAGDVGDADALLLVDGASPGPGWSRTATFGEATVWRRSPD